MSARIEIPSPPEFVPSWAWNEARQWQNLSDFDILIKAESICSCSIELMYKSLTPNLWGFNLKRGGKARIIINALLSPRWRRFALFHEIYHLIHHPKGERFWSRTATPLSSFEYEADMFAWAAMWQEFEEAAHQ
ncbi:MAG: hypothetical protein PWR28_131 [Synergistaceae bacterium]|jgi:Zn-dependent peptidase ImmA (M78 family)|nr:hypothetical protein [Synergistaceae bacterium]HQE21057.1 ImmA/IrrE family metallo-endopeptidase [Thermosynergistes sp.]